MADLGRRFRPARADPYLIEEPMSDRSESPALRDLLAPHIPRIEADLERWLVEDGVPASLADAMRYAVLGGGKRLRPALVWMSCRAVGGAGDESVRRSAVAVELVHCYSLVHDDLPSMDDDALRRGRPTVHVRFGQAMAVLVGDALLTRAFGVLGGCPSPLAGRLVAELAAAAGATGMIAGQVGDMALCELPGGLEGLRYVHLRKTAALIRAAARMGAICAGAKGRDLDAVGRWAELLGLAFQLVDDILDVTGEAAQLGKTPGKDARMGKQTSVGWLGLEESARAAGELSAEAADALAPLGPAAAELRTLAHLLAERTH